MLEELRNLIKDTLKQFKEKFPEFDNITIEEYKSDVEIRSTIQLHVLLQMIYSVSSNTKSLRIFAEHNEIFVELFNFAAMLIQQEKHNIN